MLGLLVQLGLLADLLVLLVIQALLAQLVLLVIRGWQVLLVLWVLLDLLEQWGQRVKLAQPVLLV